MAFQIAQVRASSKLKTPISCRLRRLPRHLMARLGKHFFRSLRQFGGAFKNSGDACLAFFVHFGHHVVELINATAPGLTTHEAVRKQRTMTRRGVLEMRNRSPEA